MEYKVISFPTKRSDVERIDFLGKSFFFRRCGDLDIYDTMDRLVQMVCDIPGVFLLCVERHDPRNVYVRHRSFIYRVGEKYFQMYLSDDYTKIELEEVDKDFARDWYRQCHPMNGKWISNLVFCTFEDAFPGTEMTRFELRRFEPEKYKALREAEKSVLKAG